MYFLHYNFITNTYISVTTVMNINVTRNQPTSITLSFLLTEIKT